MVRRIRVNKELAQFFVRRTIKRLEEHLTVIVASDDCVITLEAGPTLEGTAGCAEKPAKLHLAVKIRGLSVNATLMYTVPLSDVHTVFSLFHGRAPPDL